VLQKPYIDLEMDTSGLSPFLSVTTASVLPLESPKHGLNPVDATVSIRGDDCRNCTYIQGLSAWTNYYLKLRSHNLGGYGGFTSDVSQTPKEIPGPARSLVLVVLSGTEINAYFKPPATASGVISRYTLQWDTDIEFSNAIESGASCATVGYGSCEIVGTALSVNPPYSHIITQLTSGTKYYVRVAARNEVEVQQTDPTGSIPDNTRWSETANAIPYDQPPSAPPVVTASVAGKTQVQLLVTPPASDGGSDITNMTLEWAYTKAFTGSSYDSVVVDYSSLHSLPGDGRLVYELSGLKSGKSYWIRVSMNNAFGTSDTTSILEPVTPAGEPDMPSEIVLSSVAVSDQPITNITVNWAAASDVDSDGGSPITGYLVEWWEERAIPEVQLVRFISTKTPARSGGTFSLGFYPTPDTGGVSGVLPYNVEAVNLRSELINIGYIDNEFVIGDVTVERELLVNTGYQWYVTFDSDINAGDQVKLFGTVGTPFGKYVDVVEHTSGSRAGGFTEIQILRIASIGSSDIDDLQGFFTLSFRGNNEVTQYLPVDCSEDLMIRALEQLSTIRQVSVSRTDYNGTDASDLYAGYEWKITFLADVGNLPAIYVDSYYVSSSATSVYAEVFDGDNSINEDDGRKISYAMPGETPAFYHSVIVSSDTRNFVIPNLTAGTEYFVSVAAINAYGVGPVKKPIVPSHTPLKQKPNSPTDVSVDVDYGSASTLKVSFNAPTSNGGDDITKYRIELDNVQDFSTSIYNEISCPTANLRTVYKIVASGFENDPIYSGDFKVQLKANGYTYTSDYIPYDATAKKGDEVGFTTLLNSFTATLPFNGSITLDTNINIDELLFAGDRIQISSQLYPDQIFVVNSTNSSTNITLDSEVFLVEGASLSSLSVYRYNGGRGTASSSRVACVLGSLCSLSRVKNSGSIESKLELLSEAIVKGVEVERDEFPDATNGYTWRVTFLDDAPAEPYDYVLSLAENNVLTLSGRSANIHIGLVVDGETYTTCTGTHVVPADKSLTLGEYYYARVFAYNSIGFSLPQVAPSAQKPMVVPGRPTSVVLQTMSKCSLRVKFNPPDSDGGDTITEYIVEYSVNSDFTDSENVTVAYVEGNGNFFKSIDGLEQGVYYFVRVFAVNSQGAGSPATSTPASMQPYEASSAPTNVLLAVTSNSMLTVSFGYPENDGGDDLISYQVDWDTSPLFNGIVSAPHRGSVTLDATSYNSYTIQYLTEGKTYYVRVYAINSADPSVQALTTPAFAKPALQIPGKPHTIIAESGSAQGSIYLMWQRPRIPWHDIPCSGTLEAPHDCPTAIGGGLPASTGGTPIKEYLIAYNEREDFKGYDAGEHTTTGSSFTITGLTPGRLYYIRVLARNSVGSGLFCSYLEPNCITTSSSVVVSATATM